MLALFAVNAYICRELFWVDITKQTGSIEGAFISFSRWLRDHADWKWFPMWVTGTPVRQVYNPLLNVSVAELSRLAHWTPEHAYHFLTAVIYCLGPVTLFWLCYRVTYRLGFALLAGSLYSLISPSTLLFSAFRIDAGGWLVAKRLETLVVYGEGPHLTALAMIPLVIWILDEAASARKWLFLLVAPFALAALVLTNWTGTTGLSLAIAAYCLSKLSAAKTYGSRPLHWPTFVGIGIIAYMLASPWIPPSLVRAAQASTADMDVKASSLSKVFVVLALGLAAAGLHFLFSRFRTNSWVRFFVYFAGIGWVVVAARIWFTFPLVPIGTRFHLEMEMGLAGAVAYAVVNLARRLPRWGQAAAVVVLAIACVVQVRNYHHYASGISQPIDFPTTVEYKMAHWFAGNMQDRRVFAPGTTSYWMNLYSDVPQFYGCCDQSVRNHELMIAQYQIYHGEKGETATTWLKAYGIAAIGVAATGTSQLGQPFRNPRKFDGVLPEAWRDGGSVVYRVPGETGSLAHVVNRLAIVKRPPVDGLDVDQLVPLVAALERPGSAAGFSWLNSHEAEITAQTGMADVVFVQETYDPGWHATESDREVNIVPDALGLMTIEPGGAGPHVIRMRYTQSREDILTRIAQMLGVLLLLFWVISSAKHPPLSL